MRWASVDAFRECPEQEHSPAGSSPARTALEAAHRPSAFAIAIARSGAADLLIVS